MAIGFRADPDTHKANQHREPSASQMADLATLTVSTVRAAIDADERTVNAIATEAGL